MFCEILSIAIILYEKKNISHESFRSGIKYVGMQICGIREKKNSERVSAIKK